MTVDLDQSEVELLVKAVRNLGISYPASTIIDGSAVELPAEVKSVLEKLSEPV